MREGDELKRKKEKERKRGTGTEGERKKMRKESILEVVKNINK